MSALKFVLEFISKKENLINSILLYALSVIGALNILLWKVSIMDKVAIASGAAIISIMFMVNIKYLKFWQFCLVLINLLSLTMTLVLSNGDGLGVVLTAFYFTTSIVLYNSISFDKKAINISRYIICGAILVLFAMSKYTKIANGNWINVSDGITGEEINNNSISILIAAVTLLFVVLLKKYYEIKGKGSLAVVGVITVLGMFAAYLFSGRIAIASIAFFFVLLMLRGIKVKSSLYRPLCIIMFILAIIIPVIYINLYHLVGNFNFMGKDFFTGRQDIWNSAFEQIYAHPIFGSGTALNFYEIGYSTESTHNAMLGIWKNVGIIPLVTVIICFFNRRYEYIKLEDRAIFAFLVIMFTESFFMDSHFSFIFLALMLRSHDQIEADLPKTSFEKWIDKIFHSKRKAEEASENDT